MEMITLPPAGIPHGPHLRAFEKSISSKDIKELAVMADTFHPLMLTKQALDIENENYVMSWVE
jgi:homogentisate 1,2-dioxygenase